MELHLRSDGYHQQILPELRCKETGSPQTMGLCLWSDWRYQQILPQLRGEKARNLRLRLRTAEHCNEFLPELR